MQETNQSKEPQGNLYAVYGTLRQGFYNHRLLDNEHSTLLGTMRTEPKFKMVSLGGFPGVIPDAGTQEVVVEVYHVDCSQVERRLDILESYPNFYGKTTIDTPWGTANMYTLTEEEYGDRPVVASGDWTNR